MRGMEVSCAEWREDGMDEADGEVELVRWMLGVGGMG